MGKKFIVEEVTESSGLGGCLQAIFWVFVILIAIRMCAG